MLRQPYELSLFSSALIADGLDTGPAVGLELGDKVGRLAIAVARVELRVPEHLVFDPFAGSGTTPGSVAAVVHQLSRDNRRPVDVFA